MAKAKINFASLTDAHVNAPSTATEPSKSKSTGLDFSSLVDSNFNTPTAEPSKKKVDTGLSGQESSTVGIYKPIKVAVPKATEDDDSIWDNLAGFANVVKNSISPAMRTLPVNLISGGVAFVTNTITGAIKNAISEEDFKKDPYLRDIINTIEQPSKDLMEAAASVNKAVQPQIELAKSQAGVKEEYMNMPISEAMSKDVGQGFKKLGVAALSQIPQVVGLAMAGGGSKARTFISGATLGTSQAIQEEYEKDKDISGVDVAQSAMKGVIEGLTEMIFDTDLKSAQNIGKAIIDVTIDGGKKAIKDLIETVGKDGARDIIVRNYKDVVKNGLKGMSEESLEEVIATGASFVVDAIDSGKLNVKDWKQLGWDLLDASLLGATIGGPLSGLSAIYTKKNLTEEQKSSVSRFQEVAKDQTLSPEIRQIAKNRADEIVNYDSDLIDKEYSKLAALPLNERIKAFGILSKMNSVREDGAKIKDMTLLSDNNSIYWGYKKELDSIFEANKPEEEEVAPKEAEQVTPEVKAETEKSYAEELARANENFKTSRGIPSEPMKIAEGFSIKANNEDIDVNNEFSPSPNYPIEVSKKENAKPVKFTSSANPDASLEGEVYNVQQNGKKFATVLATQRNGVQEYYVPELEDSKPFANLEDAKFAVQEKLTGIPVDEKERSGIDRLRADKFVPKSDIIVKADNGSESILDPKIKSNIKNAVDAFKTISSAPVYLYKNTEDFKRGLSKEMGEDSDATKAAASIGGGFFTNANGEDSIHINLANVSSTTVAHEIFHGTVVNVARQNPSAFAAMRDAIINKLEDSDFINAKDEKGNIVKLSAKEYLDRYSKQYSPEQQAEEFLSELTGLLATDMAKLKDKTIWETIKLAIRNLVKTAGIDIPIFDKTADISETAKFFTDLSKSLKTGSKIDLTKLKLANEKQGTKQGAPVQATGGKGKIAEEDESLRNSVPKVNVQEQARRGNEVSKKKRKLSDISSRAMAIEPTTPDDYALQYFINGGLVIRGSKSETQEKDTLFSLFSKSRMGGNTEVVSEMRSRLRITGGREAGGLSVSEIAEKTFAEYQQATKGDVGADVSTKYDYMDFKNAVESALLGYKSDSQMANALLASKNKSAETDAIALTEDEEFEKLRIQAEADAMGMTFDEFKSKLAELEGNPTIGAIEDAYVQALDMINDEDMAKLYELSDEDVSKIDALMADLDDNTGALDDKLAEQKKIVRDLEAERKKVFAAIEKAGKETQLDITGKAPIQEQLFGADTKSLTDKLNSIDTQLMAAKADVSATQSAIDFQERGTVDMFEEEAPAKAPEAKSKKRDYSYHNEKNLNLLKWSRFGGNEQLEAWTSELDAINKKINKLKASGKSETSKTVSFLKERASHYSELVEGKKEELLEIEDRIKSIEGGEKPAITEKQKTAALSKAEQEMKSIQGEIESYEMAIEDAETEIENTKYNYRETAAEIKEKKAALAKEKLSRDEKTERKEELDAELEDAADERDTYIEQYQDEIKEAKAEIKKLGKRLAKLQEANPSVKLQKQGIQVASELENTANALDKKFDFSSIAGNDGVVVAKYQALSLRHGSPYNFDKFTLSKVGAGEGRQVYGYGLYFSEDLDVAATYAKSNQGNKIKNLGILDKVPAAKRDELYKIMQQPSATIGDVRRWLSENKGLFGLSIPSGVREQIEKSFGERTLYTVQVESQDWRSFKWLDWAKPMTSSDIYLLGAKAKSILPEMQQALNRMISQQKSRGGSVNQSEYNEAVKIINMAEVIGDSARSGRFSRMTGKEFYETIQKSLGSQKNTSELLYMFGYDGVRVPTYFMLSGGKDTGKSNYVVFNDRNIKIVGKQVSKFQKQDIMAVTPKSISEIKTKNPDVELDLYENKSTKEISLSKIVVPKPMRNQGVATGIMNDITRYADDTQSRINLTPSNEFGASKARLINFYKGFGFVQNKGKDRDFSTREDMYRLPLEKADKGQTNATFSALRTENPIGFNYDTDLVARERFNIPSLKKIGEGSDRVVFDLGDNKVLKVAKTARGLSQNVYEGSYDLVEEGIIPEVFESGLNYIVTEKVEPAKGNKAVNELIRDLKQFTQKDFDNRTPKLQDVLEAHDLSYVMNYDILYGDFSAVRNWGVKNGNPIHLDGGTFGGVSMLKQYEGIKNLDDTFFREAYYKSRQAKSEFKDADNYTKFQKQGISVAPTYKYQMNEMFKDPERLVADIQSKYNLKSVLRERGRAEAKAVDIERKLADNLVIGALSKVAKVGFKTIGAAENASIYKFAQQDDLLVKDLLMGGPKWVGNKLREATLKAIQSNNSFAAKAGRAAASIMGNLVKSSILQKSRKTKEGLVKNQNNKIAMLSKSLNGMIANDQNALMRVHSLLDPEAFLEKENAVKTPADLSLMELRLYNALRDMNDFIHEWHFQNEFIDAKTYEKNKGKYFARMYEEIERKEFADLHEAIDKMPSGADFRMFKERKDFSEIELTLMNDPIYITSKRFATMIHNKSVIDFCNTMANDPAYKTYKKLEDVPENNRAGFKLLDSAGGGKRYGDLTNRYVPIALYEELRGTTFANKHISSMYDLLRAYDGMPSRQYLKKSLTVWQPTTRAGNITSNFAFGWLAGIDPFTMIKNRVKAKDSLDNYDTWAEDLAAEGLLGTDIIVSDLAQRKKQAERDKPNFVDKYFVDKYKKGEEAFSAKLAEKGIVSKEKIEKAKKVRDAAVAKAIELDKYLVDSYGRTDDISKIALYRSLVDDYGKSKEEALGIVAESMQNYATVGKAYQFFSKMPVFGNPFVKFSSDLARIITNGLTNRPLYMASFLGMLYGMHRLLSGLSGEPEDEREARVNRPFIPKIPLGFTDIPLVWKIGNKEFNVARFITPYYVYDAGYRSSTLAELSKFGPLQLTYEDKVGIVSDYMPAFGDPTIAPIIQVITDKDFKAMNIADPYESIFTRQTVTENEAAINRVNYLGKSYLSPAWGITANLIAAAKGEPDVYGRRRDIAGAILNNVIKVQDIESKDVQKFVTNEIKYIDSEYKQTKTDITSRRNKDADKVKEIYQSDLSDADKKEKIKAIDNEYNVYVNEMIQKQQELMEKRAAPFSRLYNMQHPKKND